MTQTKRIASVLAVALLVLASSRSARADEFDHLMVITFSAPVQIPGEVLPAGRYQFSNPDGDRHVVEIRSADGSNRYATLLTIPEERSTATDETVVKFEERSVGSPEAIRAIFYPGETTGVAFLYPTDTK